MGIAAILHATASLLWIYGVTTTANSIDPVIAPFYSSQFVAPSPPNINLEFRANYMQHKYDVNINNHIISGFIYMSPTLRKIRLDGADDGDLESSIFDFTNTTSDGSLVSNVILSYTGSLASPRCDTFFVPPFIPLLPSNILAISGAVYTGVERDDIYGPVNVWMFNFTDVVVKMFIDGDTLLRFDFAAPGPLRTFATTRFFNIIRGPVNETTFEIKCP